MRSTESRVHWLMLSPNFSRNLFYPSSKVKSSFAGRGIYIVQSIKRGRGSCGCGCGCGCRAAALMPQACYCSPQWCSRKRSPDSPVQQSAPVKPDEETMTIRQSKYLNNLVEQDHRNIKRRTRLMLGFKSFRRAQTILVGIELIHMIRKGQFHHSAGDGLSPAEQFYRLAA